ncbi:MAG: cell division protein ZapA [Synergistetes bacterium]|nr:cell division protein ZapA [Synergistota bacterium]MCX8127386.1 cell division protein ZapA [Synergistota bacterium]MDW8192250.1 cell division protein ZapA [Synergistota bacterium]
MAKVRLTVLGESYWIKGEDPEEKLQEVALLISSTLEDVERKYPQLKDKEKLLMLALTLAEKLVSLKFELIGISRKVEECLAKD